MKLLVFGKTGQVARELALLAPQAVFLGRDSVDLEQADQIKAAIAHHRPDAIINAAAYTAVDRAESERDKAYLINATAPAIMAETAAKHGAIFIHISTDYVFDGTKKSPHSPDHPRAPLNIYGASKAAGEDAVIAAGGIYAILRTSWVFSAHGNNFVKTMLRLGAAHANLRIINDQHGGPTAAADIAQACMSIASQLLDRPQKGGVYHFSGAPDTSWHGFAQEIFAQNGASPNLEPIPTSAYPTPARRPENTRLNCDLTQKTFGITRPDWRKSLRKVIATLKEESDATNGT